MILVLLVFVFAACTGNGTEEAPDPLELITDAAENIREMDTFRMIAEQTGAPYFVETQLGAVEFKRAEAQYVAPEEIQAEVRLLAAGLPAEVGIFSRADDQWYRNELLTANRWFNADFSPGFNPRTLIAEETGFQTALEAMIDIEYIGAETLASGAPTYHLKARAQGEQVTALMAGLVEMSGEVEVDLFIHRDDLYPVRFIIVQPGTETEDEPDPTTWTIDIYDVNAEPDIEDPATDPNTITLDGAAGEVVEVTVTAESPAFILTPGAD